MIYIATILSDINQRTKDDKLSHFALLIEEPEAHLHPQLQLNLYNFLKNTNREKNSQLFITTHSPTLTSKVNFDKLVLLDNLSFRVSNCFVDRESENLIENTTTNKKLKNNDFLKQRKKLERYIDVTKSQLFFAKGVLLIEGITEEILVPAFCNVQNFSIDDFQIEIVNVDGTSFNPFIHLFNSKDPLKKIPKKVSIITDEDQYPASKETQYSFEKLIENNYQKLDELYDKIKTSPANNRVANLKSSKNSAANIEVYSATKTFEFEFALCNINDLKDDFQNNFLVNYIKTEDNTAINQIESYLSSLTVINNKLNDTQKFKVAILLWKLFPSKAEFAQDFALYISENLDSAKLNLKIPQYIVNAVNHLKS